MRMFATHTAGKAEPTLAKKKRAQVLNIAAPLKGLSHATRFSTGDSQTATILKNFYVEDDSITVRAGYKKTATRGTAPVECLIPWYGEPNAMAAASNGEIWDAQTGNRIQGGFGSNDWHWTAFSNLGEYDYTVMVNGVNGVWSWNGSLVNDTVGPIPATNLTSANPAVVTVLPADIGKFAVLQVVHVAGAVGPGTSKANGYRTISSIAGNNITLNVDTRLDGVSQPTQATGVTLNPTAGIVKESVSTTETWFSTNNFSLVVAHMNRLFFADKTNLAVYYLPVQVKTGVVKVLPLNAVFRRGGSIRAMYTWTVDSGAGMDDLLVLFSTNGECVIYKGTDPDTNFTLVGIFRFDSPMSKHSIAQYGGELYVLISTGLVPLSELMKAETEHLGQGEKTVTSIFLKDAINFRTDAGWQVFLNPSSGRMFCNVPQGAANRYKQMIRHMPKEVWSEFDGIPARCWNWIDPIVYFGDDSGNVYEMHPQYRNDDGKAITVDVQMAWSTFKTPSKKRFMVIQTYLTTDGAPQPSIDIKVDYDYSKAYNTPDISEIPEGASWDTATWDVDYWAQGERAITIWNGVAAWGQVGAVRLTMAVQNTTFSVNGFDVVFESGLFGG